MSTAVSEFGRVYSKNSRESFDEERRQIDEQIDKTTVALRQLMQRKVELEIGSRIMYGMNPEREAAE